MRRREKGPRFARFEFQGYMRSGCHGCKGCNGCSPELQMMSGCSSCSSCSGDTLAYYWISRVESMNLEKIKDEKLRAKVAAILKTRTP